MWKILGSVKAQFDTFGEILAKVQSFNKQRATLKRWAQKRTMQRKLREVENPGVNASNEMFGFASLEDSDSCPDLAERSEG